MGAISNLVKETELLPAITREQLARMQSFNPKLHINDITQPVDRLWEFKCLTPKNENAYVWMSEDGLVIATAFEEPGKRDRGREFSSPIYREGVGVKHVGWNRRYSANKGTDTIRDEYGLHGLGTSLVEQIRIWAIVQVEERQYGDGADYYGRVWDLPTNERCPVCGQPDNCGDCTHGKLTNEQVAVLRG